jgi:ferredoxin--NADP+ reductase
MSARVYYGTPNTDVHNVMPAELAQRYDAVIYAVGAQSDRPLGIPGEDLPGSIAAVDFVGWYNAHPHFADLNPDVSSGRAVVVGNGNVALDVARILVTDPDALARTDIADHALSALCDRGVEEVPIIGRRGPLQAPSPRWNCANWATWPAWPTSR